jgi:Rrf2 family iron-sulfur cluster assembly transcriptional regulator
MSKLSGAGLVGVLPGKHGGYQIMRDLNTVFLYQISGLVEGLEDFERCVLGFSECSDENPCSLHRHWLKHRTGIKEMMYNTSLADLDFTEFNKY